MNEGPPAVGRRAIQETAQSFMTAFPDLRVLLNELVVRDGSGDHADYHWTLIGTNSGPCGTGNRVHIRGVEHWQFGADGLQFHEENLTQQSISGKSTRHVDRTVLIAEKNLLP